jgi:ribosomal-protein-alanine N-acetyltransferase
MSIMRKTAISVAPHFNPSLQVEARGYANHWRHALPVLASEQIILREVRVSDAAALKSFLTTPETTRFISAPPSSVEGFEQFISASQRARAEGRGACFAVTVRGSDIAIGLVQVRMVTPTVSDPSGAEASVQAAEWGFAVGSPFWGTGVFPKIAALAMEFAFEHMGVQRLEARCAVENARGRRALQKVGARAEAILRNAFVCRGELLDQVLYAIADNDWLACRAMRSRVAVTRVH